MEIIRRFIFTFFLTVLVVMGTFFAGFGIVQIVHWLGYRSLPETAAISLGPLAVLILYVIPKGLSYLFAWKNIIKYFPVTNDKIQIYRQFYLEDIDQEIKYLEQVVEAFHRLGMRDDYIALDRNLNSLMEIKTLVQNGMDLKSDHLVCLNQVFNKGYYLKKLKH